MRRLGLWLALLCMPGARAEEPEAADPLLPAEVLAASKAHFPGILEALARRQAAAGRVTEALGAFDLVFSAAASDRVEGFYEGAAINGKALKPLRPLGARAYAEYAISTGEFPLYEDAKFTNTGGTVKLGLLFSLLRNRDIDSRRFAEIDAGLALQRADLEVLLTRIGVQQRALAAYWRWLATGRQLAVYDNLLAIALKREGALQREVASGRRAQIFITENRQNIIRRQTLTTVARRDFQVAANRLSFSCAAPMADLGSPLCSDCRPSGSCRRCRRYPPLRTWMFPNCWRAGPNCRFCAPQPSGRCAKSPFPRIRWRLGWI